MKLGDFYMNSKENSDHSKIISVSCLQGQFLHCQGKLLCNFEFCFPFFKRGHFLKGKLCSLKSNLFMSGLCCQGSKQEIKEIESLC